MYKVLGEYECRLCFQKSEINLSNTPLPSLCHFVIFENKQIQEYNPRDHIKSDFERGCGTSKLQGGGVILAVFVLPTSFFHYFDDILIY